MHNSARRRILIITPRDPYPVIGGDRLRIHRLARELSKYHDLTLLTLCRSERERLAPLPDDGVFKQVHRVVLPPWRSWLNALVALPSSEPLQIAYYSSPAFHRLAQQLAPRHDAAIAHLIRTADYARGLPAVRVLELTDAISMSMQRIATTPSDLIDPRRLLYRIEAKRLASHERLMAKQFDLVTLSSRVDADFLFKSHTDMTNSIMIVPNGSDIPRDIPPHAQRSRSEIVFVGNLHSYQNFEAAWFFANHVLPRVRQAHSAVRLRVIGPIGKHASRKLAALPGVCIEGMVPRLPIALATARIGVCPVRTGSGVKNKLLDYFANRLAVVSTSPGLEGSEARADEHVLVADEPDQWVAQVLRLLNDDTTAERLADAGHQLVCERYRWEGVTRSLIGRLNLLLAQAPQRVVADAAELLAPVSH